MCVHHIWPHNCTTGWRPCCSCSEVACAARVSELGQGGGFVNGSRFLIDRRLSTRTRTRARACVLRIAAHAAGPCRAICSHDHCHHTQNHKTACRGLKQWEISVSGRHTHKGKDAKKRQLNLVQVMDHGRICFLHQFAPNVASPPFAPRKNCMSILGPTPAQSSASPRTL